MIRWSRMDGDTRQDHGGGIADTLLQLGLAVWALKPLVDGFARFGLRKTRNGVWCGTWRHREGYVEAKHSHEGSVAVGWKEFNLDNYAPEVKWFKEISKGRLENV